jgi:hypothetical protein
MGARVYKVAQTPEPRIAIMVGRVAKGSRLRGIDSWRRAGAIPSSFLTNFRRVPPRMFNCVMRTILPELADSKLARPSAAIGLLVREEPEEEEEDEEEDEEDEPDQANGNSDGYSE